MTEFIKAYFPIPSLSVWIISGLITFIVALIGIAGRNYLNASKEFKNIIYTQLKGIFPGGIRGT